MKIVSTIGAGVLALVLAASFVSDIHAQTDLFNVDVAGLTDGVPFPGAQGVSVKGQNKPAISITVTPNRDASGYSQYELWIDSSRKTQWQDSTKSISYAWQLCAAGTTSGSHDITIKGIDTFSNSQDLTAPKTVWITDFDENANCGDPGTTGQDKSQLSLTAGIDASNTKIVNATLSLSSNGISESDLCSKYVVELYVFPPILNNGAQNGNASTGIQKGTFCSPSVPTIQTVDWNTSGSGTTPGNYLLRAQALSQGSGANLQSNQVSVPILADGAVNTPTTVTTGGGTTNTTPSSGGGSNVSLKPIQFLVPDLSRFNDPNLTGFALLNEAVRVVLDIIIIVVSAFAIIAFLYSGVMYGLSFGDPAKAEKAKKNLLWAVYGVVVVIMSTAILTIISRVIHTIPSK